MRQFELWLDESGNFNDTSKHNNPSLVGGILCEKESISLEKLKDILGEDFTHCSGLDISVATDKTLALLPFIKESGGHLVIFENGLRLTVINSTITYLNIISEGIILILQQLSAEYSEGHLSVYIAVRSDMAEQYTVDKSKIIPYEEYKIRLQEKIILGMAKKTLDISKKWTWDISFGFGQKDIKLMAADPVCNFWLTRTSSKYSPQDKYYLEELYEDKYKLCIFAYNKETYLKKMISQGDLAEAIYEICTSNENDNMDELMETVITRLSLLDYENRRIQFIYLKTKIEVLLRIDKNINQSTAVLTLLQEKLIKPLKKGIVNMGTFELDIYLYLLTAYTHTGNVIKAEEEIKLFEEAFLGVVNRWESIEYYFIFKLRKAVHLINCFDYKGTIKELNKLVGMLNGIADAFSIVDGLDDVYGKLKSDLLGKALGTRIQAYCLNLDNDESAYEHAISDYEIAIEEFQREEDKIRQFQYRAQIELEAGNYLDSLNFLLKVSGQKLKVDEEGINSFLRIIRNKNTGTKYHAIKLYLKIMAYSISVSDEYIADLLYCCLYKEESIISEIEGNSCNDHPFEIIYWKLGTYYGIKDKNKDALAYYDKAIEICFSDDKRLTMRSIGMAIVAERAAFLFSKPSSYRNQAINTLREFNRKYNSFMKEAMPQAMEEYFEGWNSIIKKINEVKDVNHKSKLLWKISNSIAY